MEWLSVANIERKISQGNQAYLLNQWKGIWKSEARPNAAVDIHFGFCRSTFSVSTCLGVNNCTCICLCIGIGFENVAGVMDWLSATSMGEKIIPYSQAYFPSYPRACGKPKSSPSDHSQKLFKSLNGMSGLRM